MPAAPGGGSLTDSLVLDTPSGPARATLEAGGERGLVVLGHGAGGGIDAPDLVAVAARLDHEGWSVARVEQPYRVKGRRAPEAAPRLDAAWVAVVTELRERVPGGWLVVGGRSSGARVACRTANTLSAHGVIALAFPLHPPGRPERSRAEELVVPGVPVLVVQGDRDPFGVAAEFPAVQHLAEVPGDHSLRNGAAEAAEAVAEWLAGIAG